MQNYQLFWNQEIAPGGHRQLLIDWDLFIRNFTAAVSTHAHYQLNSTQKQFIKAKIDPLQTNQIYKSAFLLFAKQYWDLPSNRTNLFKMKINLKALPKLTLLTGASHQSILIAIRYKSTQGSFKHLRFELKNDTLSHLDEKGFETSAKEVQESGFVSIGEAETNDLRIEDCYYLNKEHLKLIGVKTERKIKNQFYSQQKQQAVVETEWFLRDIAKSNRLRYLLDSPWKYVMIKPGMVISLGLTDDIELRIDKIGYNSSNFMISESQRSEMMSLLNSDRINILGEIDKTVPLKTVLDMDFLEITAKQIEQLYQQEQYYPERTDRAESKSSNKDKDSASSVTFRIINKRTFSSKQYVSKEMAFSVGRGEECTYRIQDVSVRQKQVQFQFISNRWTVKSAGKMSTVSLDSSIPSVYLASAGNLEENRNSNRLRLREGQAYVVRGKSFEVEIEIKQPAGKQQLY